MKISLNNKYYPIRNFFILIFSCPLAWLFAHFFIDGLMPNPFSVLAKVLGHSALFFLLLSLAISPLRFWLAFFLGKFNTPWGRRMADWNFLIRLRRPIGLTAFFYSCLHVFIYFYLELDFIWGEFTYEVMTRRFVGVGVIVFVVMAILAITSVDVARKKMGKWWLRLHKVNYTLCVLAILHYWMFAKVTNLTPFVYFSVLILLLLHRIILYVFKLSSRGKEADLEVVR